MLHAAVLRLGGNGAAGVVEVAGPGRHAGHVVRVFLVIWLGSKSRLSCAKGIKPLTLLNSTPRLAYLLEVLRGGSRLDRAY